MNGQDWAVIEEIGPPPNNGTWFPAGRWECLRGHTEIGGFTVGHGHHSNCSICDLPLRRMKAGWIKSLER